MTIPKPETREAPRRDWIGVFLCWGGFGNPKGSQATDGPNPGLVVYPGLRIGFHPTGET